MENGEISFGRFRLDLRGSELWHDGKMARFLGEHTLRRHQPVTAQLSKGMVAHLAPSFTMKQFAIVLDKPGRQEAANASVSIFVLVREGFTGGRVDEISSSARQATY